MIDARFRQGLLLAALLSALPAAALAAEARAWLERMEEADRKSVV